MANKHKTAIQERAAQETIKRCRSLLASGKRVEAIKAYRSTTGASLNEAMIALGIK